MQIFTKEVNLCALDLTFFLTDYLLDLPLISYFGTLFLYRLLINHLQAISSTLNTCKLESHFHQITEFIHSVYFNLTLALCYYVATSWCKLPL